MQKSGIIDLMNTNWDKQWKTFSGEARFRSNLDKVSRAILAFVNGSIGPDVKNILEVGCGTGRFCFYFAERFKSARVLGTDISKDAIELCEKSKIKTGITNVEFRVMDIYKIGFPDDHFDVSFSEGVLQHIPDDLSGLKEMVRVTKKGGTVFAALINKGCFPHTIYKALKGKRYENYPEKSYTHKSLTRLFQNAGLKDIKIRGVYPGYGMQRIEGYLPLLGPIIAQLMYLAAFLTDRFTDNWFSDRFGIQIVAKGTKA